MTSDENRRMRMLDSADDAVILPDHQIGVMYDELDALQVRLYALVAEMNGIREKITASGEARLRKQRRHATTQGGT